MLHRTSFAPILYYCTHRRSLLGLYQAVVFKVTELHLRAVVINNKQRAAYKTICLGKIVILSRYCLPLIMWKNFRVTLLLSGVLAFGGSPWDLEDHTVLLVGKSLLDKVRYF